MWWVILGAAAAVILLLLIILLFSKLTVFFNFYHGQDNDHISIKFRAWFGLIRYNIQVPLIKIDDDSPSIVVEEKVEAGQKEEKKQEDRKKFTPEDFLDSLKDAEELIRHVFGLHTIIRRFFRKVAIRDIEWHTLAGIGDAAHTAVLAGIIWSAKGSMIGLLSHYMRMREMPVLSVTPHFQAAVSQTRFSCMFQFRIGQAMLAGIKLIKYWKGGMPDFRTKPLSVLSDNKTKSV
ncbi:DUF2953 domain-containing protein [Bacillus infantis]|jgi:Protein of unknown function (DUF2953)|uniref:DUF2953 domain-containing protein n=1 Tax=Bacillus infantis TaxID=324767 RepID=UPI002155010F|nr:DUF2953 domain-containing protein [Bacillus infantis]MCR6612301.1 DUF2953 domain-containing protein [Bacillus infantis]